MNNKRTIFYGRITAAVFLTAALMTGGCTPSGNLISQEKREVDYVTQTPIPEATPTPKATPTPTVTPTPTGVITPVPIGGLPILIPQEQPAASIYYSTANVNVRSEPSMNGKILGSIVAKTKVDVLEIVENTWARIDYNGQDGYVHRKYLVSEEQNNTGIAEDTESRNTAEEETNNNETEYASYDDYEGSGGGAEASGQSSDNEGGSAEPSGGNTSDEGTNSGAADGGSGNEPADQGGSQGEGSPDGGSPDEGGSDEGGSGGMDEGGDAEGGADAGEGSGEVFDEVG